ncbi:MAG TPA: ATP-dependent sacrificial sulfur transferase LarE [Candidatus Competibacteraceae bacterium]|nr:ATP-dependent sacrificial sulfur transferase LarE [Candidatus Competibacteraceae bacterium]HRZ06504.1 ATP-dependent sacrificial sulfur transferase LarE [Candidatus Competibacteraceae bacterium]HSA47319.1 ATP-dependent sacrificial sulfur transferase LarE [Candidatus Competibacteraceae bacterium]
MTAEASSILAEPGYQRLLEILRSMDSIAVACSGGLDSSLLLAVAHRVLGERVLALTVMTPYMASWEIAEAQDLTTRLGIRHQLLTLPIPDDIAHNPPDRCYRCKRMLFAELKAVAAAEGLIWLADGTNQDDLSDYRLGMRALQELAVRSPLLEAGLGKADLRRYARALNLPVWNKPASACLLTRLPHDTEVQPELLRQIEAAEQALLNLGFGTVRVRCHGDLARIEVDRAEQARLLQDDIAAQIVAALTGCGFHYVTLDLSGYRMGSFNRVTE